jgi:hypothetical protein
MLARTAVLLCAAGTMLLAADNTATLQPPGLNQFSRDQFQQLFSKSFSQGDFFGFAPKTEKSRQLAAGGRECSIPLLEMKIKHPERFSMRRLPMRNTNADPMVARIPAPACKNWGSEK